LINKKRFFKPRRLKATGVFFVLWMPGSTTMKIWSICPDCEKFTWILPKISRNYKKKLYDGFTNGILFICQYSVIGNQIF